MANVLVVDDSSTMREIVASFLSKNGFEVAVANDGRDGLFQLSNDPGIRLVISDVNMPNMDGLAMAKKIREEFSDRVVHIIMLTTEDNPAMRTRGKDIGVTGWIVKPFRGEAVLGPLRKLCEISGAAG
ncbi:two-component system chemotaxis response regulator CheY [Paucibacter oligotrophus]|uniref:Two-component system chemotaxis response regulator CheY n=1 Tax=Roseateles oligotrophus TaxID=1769250 RepID=A0A840LBT3_9BURK|nr:response regulator [Roseateles oligotrophus]MBB4845620.1 two-component system chemotaxis response regulator CheY [Roseateles oligotrophus]